MANVAHGLLKLYIPENEKDTVRLFKALCALRETSVSAALLAYMKAQVDKEPRLKE